MSVSEEAVGGMQCAECRSRIGCGDGERDVEGEEWVFVRIVREIGFLTTGIKDGETSMEGAEKKGGEEAMISLFLSFVLSTF